ncbi:hypothetical protein CR513_17161, partial [Mucuna pruriens]
MSKFTPAHGSSGVTSRIIKQKFDEPWLSWKKVRLEVHDLWFGEFKVIYTFGSISIVLFIVFSFLLNSFLMQKEYRWDLSQEQSIRAIFEQKGSCIFKNAMSKIKNDQDRATWILPNVQTILDKHWSSTDFQKKSLIAKSNRAIDKEALTYCDGSISTSTHYEKLIILLKYQQSQQELQQFVTEEGTSANDSSSTPINDNIIYLQVVGGKNEKGNVYGLGKLTNKFMCSTHILTNLIEMPTVQQMEEMRESIFKLNNELIAKEAKKKSLENKVVQLLHNNEEQSEQIQQQSEKMEQ